MEGDFNIRIQSLTSQSKIQPVEVKYLSAAVSFSEIRNNLDPHLFAWGQVPSIKNRII